VTRTARKGPEMTKVERSAVNAYQPQEEEEKWENEP
jgi:hypothetical protein